MRPLRVGMIGCGDHSRMSLYPSLRAAFGGFSSGLPALRGSGSAPAGSGVGEPVAALVAICDHHRDAALRVAAFHPVGQVYTDHQEMLREEELDAVIVCLHPSKQSGVAIDCLDRGLHVWVEKPAAISLPAAHEMREAARRSGRALAVGYMKRFSEPYLRARRFLSSPRFGPLSVFESRYTYGRYPLDAYRFLNGFATHHLDLARYFMGEVETVHAERVTRGEGLDGYLVVARFESGALGSLSLNCLEGWHNNWSERVAITGVGGRVFVENWRRVVGFLPGTEPGGESTYYWEPDDIQPADEQNSLVIHGFVGELADFVESIRAGRPPQCTIDDGIAALRFEAAVELSISHGRTVSTAEVDGEAV